ncbi:hypothetical protein OKW98_18295 [Pseudomonas sp. KU26590]|uniref:hypothetical protein n=1 Tax=Pseudomonas sp. KU26590 TaxID=2991051 RepID=UPI00223D4A75|nr:hypothetical protein [Pseudomonas sp. KU26590]UZJ58533.1 hypothetical protein OKW98_18295 [Pseudomonas sp. KU26590]
MDGGIHNATPSYNGIEMGWFAMFVLLGIALWAMAVLLLSFDLDASAAALFLFGLATIWPSIFYGRAGTSRFVGWYESLKIMLRGWL